jgi:hypothetical protein
MATVQNTMQVFIALAKYWDAAVGVHQVSASAR